MEAIDLRAEITAASEAALQEGSPEPFQTLDRLLDAVDETRQMQGLADITGGALSVQPLQPATYYLHGFALARMGRAEEAAKVLVSLCSRLEQEGKWDVLSILLPKVIDAAPTVDSARSLAKLAETVGVDKVEPEVLSRAYELFPDEERLAYLMGERAATAGEVEKARDFWAESLDGFVGLRRYDRLEEALLKVAESDKPEHQRHVLGVLSRLATQNQWNRLGTFIDLALPGLRSAGLVGDLWKLVLHVFPKAPEEAGLRKWIRTLAPDAFPAAEGILDLLGRSGILDPQIRIETSIKQLETLLDFAPGFHILHTSWGIGRVRLNDGDTLVLDFQETKNHRMKLSLARRALIVLPPNDLRVLQAENPGELKRLIREEPAEIIVRALRSAKGGASTQELRRSLTGQGIISTSGWTSFWKEARAALERDDRADLSQSFRQVYKLRVEGDEGEDLQPLPIIEPRRGIRPNLNLIRRFLEQHPEESARAARMYTPILERWGRDEKPSAEDRMAVHLQLHRWRGEVREDFIAALNDCLNASVEMNAFSDPRDQELLAHAALESEDLWKKGALLVLSSRDSSVRDLARVRMRLDPSESRSALIELLRDPVERPQAALAILDLVLEEPREPFAPDPWLAALGAALLVDTASKEPVRKQALVWLSIAGPLAEKLRAMDPEPGNAERWAVVLRRWRTSERYLRPVLEFLGATGHSELVGEVRAAHAERTDRILGAAAAAMTDYRGHIMTRATYRKFLHERNQLVWELKNTVAKAIQKAREHGDLRENAEYDAAKAKQSDFAQQISDLSTRLAEAKVIENLQIPPDEVAPGTEILVEDVVTREKRTIWILGEGDNWLGNNVVSYAAPLGRNLLGKRAGERVSVIGADSVHELLIRSIVRKHPATEEKPEEIQVSEEEVLEIVKGVDESASLDHGPSREDSPGRPDATTAGGMANQIG